MTSAFQQALADRDLDAIRAIPKSDLHNHFYAGGQRAFVREKTGRDIAPLDHVLGSMAEMHAWVGRQFGPVFEGTSGRLLAFEATLVQARADGITRLGVGEDVWAITLFGSAERLTDALQEVHARTAPEIAWIRQLGVSRHCAISDLERWMAPLLALGVYHTLDLYGDELVQPIERFKPVYRTAQLAGLRLKAHVGEWGSADDVWRAVEELELDEVQHGISAAGSPSVMRFLADNRIRLNVCPTSNLMLGRVESIAKHPIRQLYDAGVIVTVNTDDVLVFGKSLSEEYLGLLEAGLFSPAELDRIRLQGLSDPEALG